MPLPSSTPETLVSAWPCNCSAWSMAPRKVSTNPHSRGPVVLPSPGTRVGVKPEIGLVIPSPSLCNRSLHQLQRLLDHSLRRLHRRRVQLVSSHCTQQIGHLLDRIDVGIGDIAFAVGIRIAGFVAQNRIFFV